MSRRTRFSPPFGTFNRRCPRLPTLQVVRDAGYEAQPLSYDRHADGSALREKEKRVGAFDTVRPEQRHANAGWNELAGGRVAAAPMKKGLNLSVHRLGRRGMPRRQRTSCPSCGAHHISSSRLASCAAPGAAPRSFGGASSCGPWPSACRSSSSPWSSCEPVAAAVQLCSCSGSTLGRGHSRLSRWHTSWVDGCRPWYCGRQLTHAPWPPLLLSCAGTSRGPSRSLSWMWGASCWESWWHLRSPFPSRLACFGAPLCVHACRGGPLPLW